MKNSCIKTRELFNGYKNGSLKDAERVNEAREHVKICDSCRNAALENSLSDLLSLSFEEALPEPAPSFFVNLPRKIDDIDRQKETGIFSERLMSASLKLVPAMAALLFFITTSTAWVYQGNPVEINNYTLDEMVLFDEDEISTDTFLAEILINEVQNER
jgi:hypothetical protein